MIDGVVSVITSPMKNCQHLVLFACALTVGVCAGGVPDFSVAKLRKDHPRLFFTAETWPAVKARLIDYLVDNCAVGFSRFD